MAGAICPNCSRENSLDSEFCNMCGADLVKQCKVCGVSNPVDARFCKSCRADLQSQDALSLGLSVRRALEWREQFMKMGWWDKLSPKSAQYLEELARNGTFPSSDDPNEPWVFLVLVGSGNWKPETPTYLKKTGDKDFRPIRPTEKTGFISFTPNINIYLAATRSRLAVLVPGAPVNTVMIPYTDITGGEWYKDGKVEITTPQLALRFKVHLVGPGFLNVVVALTPAASLNTNKAMALADMKSRTSDRLAFMDVLGGFFKEIGNVS
jgi:hypothetical protein